MRAQLIPLDGAPAIEINKDLTLVGRDKSRPYRCYSTVTDCITSPGRMLRTTSMPETVSPKMV